MTSVLPLSLKKVSIGYDGHSVANDVSFDVKSGEVFGFIGLNGEGKTTLIKTLLGLRDALNGDISVFRYPSGSRDAKRNVAYLPEKFMPAWFMNGNEFVRFSASLYGKDVENEEIASMARALALDASFLSNRVHTYSKGMGQKLGLIATILTGASLLVLDEPMSGLDPLARMRVKRVLLECKKNGQTVFLSSHILSDLDELCDTIAVLDSGEVKYLGAPAQLKKDMNSELLEKAFLSVIGRD